MELPGTSFGELNMVLISFMFKMSKNKPQDMVMSDMSIDQCVGRIAAGTFD